MGLFVSWVLAASALAYQAAEGESFAIRTALVSVTDAEGAPFEGLGLDDFEVEETGLPRDVVEVRGGTGREVFLLVDTGVGFRDEVGSLRSGVEAMAATLSEPHEVLLASFGGTVEHLAGPTSDPAVLRRATTELVAGDETAFLLDAMAHVCSGVAATRSADDEPPVVVIVTALTPDASLTPIDEVFRFARESEAFFHVILYDPPQPVSPFGTRDQMENFLATLAQSSNGGFTRMRAIAQLPGYLGNLGVELAAPRYRVSFLTEVEPRSTLENLTVRVAREGARVVPVRLLRAEQVVTSGDGGESN